MFNWDYIWVFLGFYTIFIVLCYTHSLYLYCRDKDLIPSRNSRQRDKTTVLSIQMANKKNPWIKVWIFLGVYGLLGLILIIAYLWFACRRKQVQNGIQPQGRRANTRDEPVGTQDTNIGTQDTPIGTQDTPIGTQNTPIGTQDTPI